MSMEALKRLMAPAFFLLVFLLPALYVDEAILQVSSHLLQRAIRIGHYAIGIGLWLTLAWLIIRVIEVMVWPLVIERRLGSTTPRLLKDFVRLLVIVVALAAIISEVFEASISGFLAASGVAGLVLGFALRSMIADFFSGIALNLERSFSIGDHIKLEAGVDGEVVEINWRTTVLRNLPGNHVIVPNSKISDMRIENFSRPENHHLMWSVITLDFDVPVQRAERILMAAATQAQVSIGGIGAPLARVRDITELGVEYLVVYSVPDWRRRERSRSEVTRHIMHHLSVAGIRPPNPKYDIYTGELSLHQLDHQHGDAHALLKHIPLFTLLDDSEVASVAMQMKTHLFSTGEVIVKQGDVGASMYIVAEGLLSVSVDRGESGDAIQVNQLIPGEFFGEISLFTGEPRTATVKAEVNALVYEITKDAMELILEKRPEIAEQLPQVIARHRLRTAEAMKTLTVEQQEVEIQHFAAQLLQKMRRFFSVFRGSVAAKDQP
jgi:small-conductance mechanosensitive channel/CRP-like cAMP-binding protein